MTPAAASTAAPTASASVPSSQLVGINSGLAARVNATEQEILASGGNLSSFHPPNLHQAPPISKTHGLVTPLYYVAPAPIGVAYYGLNNTTGTIQGTSVNTTSLAGTWQTTDPLGTAAELFDTSSGNAAGEFGAQLNSVLVNVTLHGATAFGPDNNAPTGCSGFYTGAQSDYCPNEFWLQNYIEYTESSHSLEIGDEIWNFSNPTADFTGGGSTYTMAGFGSVQDDELYALSGSGYALTVTVAPPFTLVLYDNYTQGPCHTDSTAGTGVPSCGTGAAALSTTEPNNELFMNYTILNSAGTRVCPTTEPTGRVCGEYDDVFFNSVGSSNPSGVPTYGPDGRVGSATIQANGTAYDPVGLTNDYEFDYAIGSDDGATNNIVYQDGTVGIYYCPNADTLPSGRCATYSTTPAAVNFGGETGETSTGEGAYWTPQAVTGLGNPALTFGSSTPVVHLVTGPSDLIGLWNMTGSTYTGHTPYPAYTGGEPLSYSNIAPANAWVGIARDLRPGVEVTNQSYFQVAPTFGFYSYWGGSGGTKTPTTLGSDLYLPTGWYTIEVELSGYAPVIQQIDLTGPAAPTIDLTPDYATGAYTPDWAFSNGDLANLSVSASNTVPTGAGTSSSPYIISAPAPTVGAPFGVPGSVSWLFSNLNDYLFTQWIGAFVNSTTATTQFDPAPSFPIVYPSWQQPFLGPRFSVPDVNGLQYYLLNAQNIAVIGATDITSWGNSEATTIYSFVVNNGANILIADNTFEVSNRGIDFTGGGTADSRTINGVVVHGALAPAINVVWGNTFVPNPQSLTYSGLEPFTAQDTLTIAEAYDRVYDNAFDAYGYATGAPFPAGTLNTTANAAAADLTMWNATCQVGYAPLASSSYPPSTVCEPLSYSQTLDGYTMTGSILPGATFQGGNYWAGFGTLPDPYANIPYKARLTTETGTAEIAATTAGFAGDYAPLIDPVYKASFTETGLTSSTTATAFEITVANSAGYVVLNETATSTTPAGCTGSVCLNFDLPNGSYSWIALTSLSALAPSPAIGTFTVAGAAVGPIATTWSAGSVLTFTESGLHTGVTWYANVTGQRSISSTTTTAAITLAAGSYNYAYSSKDGQCYAGGSGSVTVSGATGQAAPFTVANYCVLFAESGLTAGLTWTVTLGGAPVSITTASGTNYIGFAEPNGVYSYSIAPVNNFAESAIAASGSITVAGAAITETTAAYTAFDIYPAAYSNPIDVGQSTTLYAFYSGGTAPYTETWSGLPPGCSSATVDATGTCTPTGNSGSPYTVVLTFTDADGNVATGSFALPVYSALSAGTTSASNNPDDVGIATSIGTNGPSGGDAQYWYAWSGLPDGCTSAAATFVCSPSDDAGSPYTVLLNVTDAAGYSTTSTFQLTVNPVLAPTFTATLATTQVGAASDLSIGSTGGTAPVSWTLQENSSAGSYLDSGTGPGSYAFAPAQAGTYTLYLNETDADGGTAYATTTIVVLPALVASLSAAPATTQVGTPSSLTVSLANGVAPYSWTLQVNGSTAVLASGTGSSGGYTFSPVGPGTYTFYLNSTDSVGSISDVTATVTVEAGLVASLSATPATTQVGGTSTIALGFSGGVAPISWTLEVNGSSANLSGVSGDSYVFAPAGIGTYTFYLNSSDAVGSISDVTTTVTVEPALVASLSPPTSTTQVGGSVTFSVGLSGGVEPVTYTLQASGPGLAGPVFTPTSPGTYTIYLNATDAVGSVSDVTATVTVEPALAASLSPPTSTIHLDGSVTFTVGHTGGVAPVTYTLQASGPGLSGNVFTPKATGTYTIYLNETDAVGSTSDVTATVTVESALVTQYAVTFTESGLPAKGKTWSVMFNGAVEKTKATSHTATVTTIEFNATNGSYVYEIIGPSGYQVSSPSPAGGTLTIAAAPLPVAVTFVKGPTPTLSVHETGIGAGVQWCAIVLPSTTLSGTPSLTVGYEQCSVTATIAFKNMTPGMYAIDGVQNDAETDLVKVGSTWVVESQVYVSYAKATTVQFRYAFLVTFTETGLTSGTSWSVTSQGQTVVSTTTTAQLYLTNGTRGYTIHAVPGYKETSSPPGHVVVAGGPASVSVTFTPKPGHVPAAGAPAAGDPLSALARAIEAALRL